LRPAPRSIIEEATVSTPAIKLSTLILVCLALLPGPVTPQIVGSDVVPIIDFGERFLPTVAAQGMIASPERLAAEAGLAMLQQGGNAIDAAVATGFALAVTYPRAGNLAGGGFMLIHEAATNRQILIDYRETAPAAAMRDTYLDGEGAVDRERLFFSRQAAGVPGTVAGLLHALDHYGSLDRATVLAPAIALAEQGFTVDFRQAQELLERGDRLRMDPEAARIFLRGGEAPFQPGEIIRQPDLAWTLREIARDGAPAFYEGAIAARISADMAANDGLITKTDLAAYQAIEREPVRGHFGDYEIIATPPPSSGGIHIVQMLNILGGFDLRGMGHNSASYLHHLTEAMKLAYADRSEFLADPAFYPVPAPQLLDADYASRLRAEINPAQARAAASIRPGAQLPAESTETTHYSVADRHGNLVSNTYTLNFSYGSHIVVPGTGMLLNNEMADFAAAPGKPNAFGLVQGEANRVEGGKRPLSSMTPTLVLREGRPWLATGSPGGSVIITTVLQVLLNAMVFDMNVAAAVSAPRIHHQWEPDRLTVEEGVSPDTLALLRALGHEIDTAARTLGHAQSIMLDGAWLYGVADPRRPGGYVAGY